MKCPNCGQSVSQADDRCPNCDFDLKKFRTEFFTDRHQEPVTSNNRRRSFNQEEFKPKKQNSTVAAMIQWVRVNATIVFLLGVLLLILMSFSRPLGWFAFAALMVWLFVVCDRNKDTQQYTVDRRLTEKVNQVGSDVFNSFEDTSEKVKARRIERGRQPLSTEIDQTFKEKRSATQLGAVLMAAISLIVVFYGPFSSSSMQSFQALSISKMLLNLGGLGGKYSFIGYGLWLLLIVIPIAIIVLTVKNKKNNRKIVFTLSLIETIILVIAAFELIFMNAGSTVGITDNTVNNGVKAQKMIANAISFGISAYLLLISSILTTVISWKSLKNQKQLNK